MAIFVQKQKGRERMAEDQRRAQDQRREEQARALAEYSHVMTTTRYISEAGQAFMNGWTTTYTTTYIDVGDVSNPSKPIHCNEHVRQPGAIRDFSLYGSVTSNTGYVASICSDV